MNIRCPSRGEGQKYWKRNYWYLKLWRLACFHTQLSNISKFKFGDEVTTSTAEVDTSTSLFRNTCLDTLGPEQQIQVLFQNPSETSPRTWGETGYPSKLRVVADSVSARWQQGGRIADPFPLSCINARIEGKKKVFANDCGQCGHRREWCLATLRQHRERKVAGWEWETNSLPLHHN